MPRVLLLLSILYMDIDILNHSPRFENTVFDALALSDLPEDHFETTLCENLRGKLDSFQPNQIILHAGRAFQKHPRAVLSALRASQLREPALQIGCDRSPEVVRRYLEQASPQEETVGLLAVIVENDALLELVSKIF